MANPFLHPGQPLFDPNPPHQNIPPNTFDGGGADWMMWGGQSYTTDTISSLITVQVTDILTEGYYPCQLISPIAGGAAYQMFVPMLLRSTAALAVNDQVMAQMVGGITQDGDYILCQHVGYQKGSFFAVISGEGAAGDCCQGQSYSWKEVSPIAGGLWTIAPGGLSGSNAYEINGNCIARGTIVELHLTALGDYRFNQCCSACNTPPFMELGENVEITEEVTIEIGSGQRSGLIVIAEMDWCCPMLSIFFPLSLTIDVVSGSCDGCVTSPISLVWDTDGFYPAMTRPVQSGAWCSGWGIGLVCSSQFMAGTFADLALLVYDGASIHSYIPLPGGSCDPFEINFGLIELPGGCIVNITITD